MWIALLLIFFSGPSSPAQTGEPLPTANANPSMHEGHQMQMPLGDAEDKDFRAAAKRLADKKESEFNHHLAGFFVVVGGLFMLAQPWFTSRWPRAKYVWPSTFLLSGTFVLVWSDTELWPFHNRRWLEALQNNPEVLQHKIFAVILLTLGCVEWWRATGRLKAVLARLVFPILAIGGSVLLLFHQHEAGMHGPNHMELMARIQAEHMRYAEVGIGLGIANALAEVKTRVQAGFTAIWPVFMIVLGVLLMFYTE